MNSTTDYDALVLAAAAKVTAERAASYQLSVALDSWAKQVIEHCAVDKIPHDTIMPWDIDTLLSAMTGSQTLDHLIERIESSLLRTWREQHSHHSQTLPWRIESHQIDSSQQRQIIRFASIHAQKI